MKDIFKENKVTPIKGLVRRYKDRVLIELTLKCPVECDFCYKKWKKEKYQKELTKRDIDKMIVYILEDKKINEIILSGGEPLLVLGLMEYIFGKVRLLDQIKIIRIHTRAPITVPKLVSKKFLDILRMKINQVVYLSIHVNRVDEINKEVEIAIQKIRKTGVGLYSQSVLLKDFNDNVEDLKNLFSKLIELGVRPYNIYQCNKIKGLEKYMVTTKKAIEIMTDLRKMISGFSCPNLIIDVPGNANKIVAP
jgi:lysine 2,3-aminomutase